MLRNYFVIAWRNILKYKFFSLVNIVGLSVGIAFTMLIAAYVYHELSVNTGLRNADNQYIIQSKWKNPDMGIELATVGQLPKALKETYPGLIANYYRWDGVTSNVSKGDKHFRESIQAGDGAFLSIYGFKLLYGDVTTALKDPFSMVITEATAIKYFGRTDVVGENLVIENFSGLKHPFQITGVLPKVDKNSVTNINDSNNSAIFLSEGGEKFLGRSLDGWSSPAMVGLVELNKGADPKQVEQAMRDLIKKNSPQQISANMTPYLVSLKDYYLNANSGLVKKMLYTLSAVAFFILLMAVINFANICISRSAQRMREMGVRKVLGGTRKQLIGQFLTESIVMVTLSTLIAFGIYAAARPMFCNLLSTDIGGLFSFPLYFYLFPAAFAVLIGLLAGSYPALVLSSLNTINSLKGKLDNTGGKTRYNKVLVVFQFATAAVVLIGAVIISQQIDLFFSKSLGYDKDYMIYAQVPRDWTKKGVTRMEGIREQLAKTAGIRSVALSWEIPDGNNLGSANNFRMGSDSTQGHLSQSLATDNQYASAYGIKLLAGEFFKPVYSPADSAKVVVSGSEVKALGFKDAESAVGQQFRTQGLQYPLTITGVVRDFQLGSMQTHIQPVVFYNVNWVTNYRFFSIRIKPGNISSSITAIQKRWAELMPEAPFEYHFMDDALNKMYKTELQLKKASYVATTLAIVIVLLGVLSLVALSVQKRTREIGIRKVLGSSAVRIVMLFIKDFALMVSIACVVACPLAYLIGKQWLSSYAYQISITPVPFLGTIAMLVLLTTVLIIVQTFKTAMSKPVNSLRSE